jgi:hypothetical protein
MGVKSLRCVLIIRMYLGTLLLTYNYYCCTLGTLCYIVPTKLHIFVTQ